MATKEKNPLSNLSHERRLQMIDDHYSTNYLIRGIRLAIATGLDVSIFDCITEISKDGKKGTITKKSINSFLDEYVENCVPSYVNYYLIETFNGVDYLVSDEQFDVGRRNIRNYDICGKNVSDTNPLKEYIRCFACAYIINCLIAEQKPNIDEYKVGARKTTWVEDNADWVIDCDEDRIRFRMESERTGTIRASLQFNVFLDKFDEQCARADSDEGDIFDFLQITKDAPFKKWGKKALSVVYSTFPVMPSLISECMIKGVENYCFNNELSLYFAGNSKKTTPNDQYGEVLKELRKAMENILTLKDKLDGEQNG